MSRNAERVLLFGLGSLFLAAIEVLAARYSNRHWLALTNQETP